MLEKEKSSLLLSGGERNNVVYWHALLAQEPTLLLLDELTNHLDIKYQLNFFLLTIVKHLHINKVVVLHDIQLFRLFYSSERRRDCLPVPKRDYHTRVFAACSGVQSVRHLTEDHQAMIYYL